MLISDILVLIKEYFMSLMNYFKQKIPYIMKYYINSPFELVILWIVSLSIIPFFLYGFLNDKITYKTF